MNEVTIGFNQQPSFQLIPDIFLQVKTHLTDVFSGSATFMDAFDYENRVWASIQFPHMANFYDPFSQESIDDTKKSPERTSWARLKMALVLSVVLEVALAEALARMRRIAMIRKISREKMEE